MSLFRVFSRNITTSSRLLSPTLKAGDSLPSIEVQQLSPDDALTNVNTAEIFKGKKAVLFGVPGAFTTACHKSHFPGFLNDYEKFTNKGVDMIACIAVNDAFVMNAWGKVFDANNKITMLADSNAEFTKAADLAFDAKVLGGTRCKRFSMYVEDGIVKILNVEPAAVKLTNTTAEKLLEQIP